MSTLARRCFTALAIAAAATASVAQTSGNAGAIGSTPGTPMAPKEASPTPTERTDGTSTSYRTTQACVGLSDRQSERACRDGHSVGHNQDQMNRSDDGGKTDDQAS